MAQLAPVVDDLKDVAEPVRQFYVQKDGKYHVDLAGAPAGFVASSELAAANAKVIEFRDNNTKLLQEVEPLRKLKTDVGDLDLTKARDAVVKVGELEKKGVQKPDDVTKLVGDAIAAALKPVTDELASEREARKTAQQRSDQLTLRSVIGEAFTKAGGNEGAIDFIVGKTSGVFKIVDGKLVTESNQFSSDRPGEPLSLSEWLTKQTKENAFAFKPSSGSGAEGNKGSGGGGGGKPGVLVINNPTPQQLGQYGDDARKGKVKFTYDA